MRQKSIPSLRQCLDEPGIIGVVAQGFAQAVDRLVESPVEINESAGRPKPLLKLFACQNLAGVLNQRHQRLKGLLLQFDPYALLAQLTGGKVNLEDPKADRRRPDIQR